MPWHIRLIPKICQNRILTSFKHRGAIAEGAMKRDRRMQQSVGIAVANCSKHMLNVMRHEK